MVQLGTEDSNTNDEKTSVGKTGLLAQLDWLAEKDNNNIEFNNAFTLFLKML